MNALNKAIQITGGQTKLAAALGVRVQVVHNWTKRGNVPPIHAPGIEAATQGQVKAEDLCPSVPWHVIRGKSDQSRHLCSTGPKRDEPGRRS